MATKKGFRTVKFGPIRTGNISRVHYDVKLEKNERDEKRRRNRYI